MRKPNRAARILALHLGLGDLNRQPTCHGYATGCPCTDCKQREQPKQPTKVRQPWEPKAA